MVNPERRYTHGGILAALVDLAADWAMVKQTGRGVPTIDMRVDYHRPPCRGDLIARGKVVRAGVAVLHRRGADLRRGGQADRQRPRHLFHRAALAAEVMTAAGFTNLGDLIAATAIWRRSPSSISAASTAPREFSYARSMRWRTALRARSASAACARRPRRDPVANRAEYLAAYYGIMRAGLCRGAGQFQVSARDHRFHLARFRRQAGVLRCGARADCPPDIPIVTFGARVRGVSRSRPVRDGRAAAATSRRCFSTPRARPARQRASCCRIRATSGWSRRGSRPGSSATAI